MPAVGKFAEFYLGGWDLTTYFDSMDVMDQTGTDDTTAFGPTTDETSLPNGIRKGMVNGTGFWTQTAVTAPIDTVLRSFAGTDTPAIFAPVGSTAGNPVVLFQAEGLTYSLKQDVGKAIRTAIKSVSDAAQRVGQSLHALAARTHPYNGGNYDAGAAGELASAAWTAVIAATNVTADLTLLIETSADGSTGWVTLTTFTAITAAASRGSQYKSGTATVHRYRRVRTTAGAGTFTIGLHAA